jgi:DNA-binding IclR family transcriptional regulator
MATDLISQQEVRLLLELRANEGRWLTNNTLAEAVGCSRRTARLHTAHLVRLGVLEQRPLFPAPVFRLKENMTEDGQGYLDRVEKAREALGL